MGTLEAIREAASSFDEKVFYGTAAGLGEDEPWNYTVVTRSVTRRAIDRSGYGCGYEVAVVRENAIPDGMEDLVVDAIEKIPGMRLADADIRFLYQVKPGTRDTAEMMIVPFVKSRKRR